MGGSSKQTIGYKYFLGMHQALCAGPIDSIKRLTVDDRTAWSGVSTGGSITLPSSAEELFGGTSREGGVSGTIDIDMGGPSQTANSYLASVLGADIPGYRGIVSAIFRQCYLGNNPYLKPWRFRGQRIHVRGNGVVQWYDAKAEIKPIDILPPKDTWKYLVTALTGSANYSSPTFNDSAWATGSAPFLENSTGLQQEGFGNTAGTVVPTFQKVWLRKTFTYNGPAGERFQLITLVDDNVSVWINGVNVLPQQSGPFLKYTIIPAGVIVVGSNQITMQAQDLAGGNIYADLQVELADRSDMNPIHIIRECLTDTDWGMGYLDSDIDDVSFEAAADTIFDEGLGVSLLWDQQITIGEFIDDVCRHIDAQLYVSRVTGKYVIKLIRNDYIPASLLLLNESNIVQVTDPTRVASGQQVNTVTVNYWNLATGKNASVTVSDSALVQLQGTIISSAVTYGGFTNSRNATLAAQRDLNSLSSTGLSCTILANSSARILNIGDVFKFTWSRWNLVELVMRVTAISYGDGKNNQVRIVCTEDVFETNNIIVVDQQGTSWVSLNTPPSGSPQQRSLEAPYYELVQQRGQGNIDSALLAQPESGYAIAIAGRPGTAINARLASDNGSGYADVGTLDFCPTGALQSNITKTQTSFTLTSVVDKTEIVVGTVFQIDDELMRVDSIDGTNVVTVGRGCLDTVPETHLAGAVAYFWDLLSGSDSEEYVLGETINLKVLPISGGGQLALADATALPITMQQRAYRPYPPGDFRVNGSSYVVSAIAGNVTLTWVHRDRKQQTAGTIIDHTAGSIGPEAGTTYRVRCFIDNILQLDTEISGLTQIWTPTLFGNARVEVNSKRDGVLSLFAPFHTFDVLGDNRGIEEIADDRATEENDTRIMEN